MADHLHDWSNITQKYDRIIIKGTILHVFQIFILKHLYLWNHSSYELETWNGSSIILLHWLGIPGPAHFQCGV